jgi:hypothetical protein
VWKWGLSEWALDTEFKFAMGCLGTFLMGLSVEGIVFGRRKLKAAAKRSAQKERDAGLLAANALRGHGWLAVLVLVYGVQVCVWHALASDSHVLSMTCMQPRAERRAVSAVSQLPKRKSRSAQQTLLQLLALRYRGYAQLSAPVALVTFT